MITRRQAVMSLWLLVACLAVLSFAGRSFAAVTPYWQTVYGNYSGYPSPTSCNQYDIYPYTTYNHCYWSGVYTAAMSAESGGNGVSSAMIYSAPSSVSWGSPINYNKTTTPSSPLLVLTGAQVQLDWSCMPNQQAYVYRVIVTGDWLGNNQYNPVLVGTPNLVLSTSAAISASSVSGTPNGTPPSAQAVNTGGALTGTAFVTVTGSPGDTFYYTTNCSNGDTSTVLVTIVSPVPGAGLPPTLAIDANPQSVSNGGTTEITYSANNVPADTTCTVSDGTTTYYSGLMPLASSFSYTGGDQQWGPAPTGLKSVYIKVWGAGGGQTSYSPPRYGGGGGFTYGQLPITAGQYLKVIVGKGGVAGGARGYGGGGAAAYSTVGSGGGRSAVCSTTGGASGLCATGTEVLTAGGGGGGGLGAGLNGGAGGGLNGGAVNAGNQYCGVVATGMTVLGNKGGSQTGPGGYSPGTWGSQFAGGDGYSCYYGAGGGSGWYGGGSTSYNAGSGGSGHINTSAVVSGTADTVASISAPVPAGVGDPDYPGNPIGYGTTNGNGYVKILGNFTNAGTPITSQALTKNTTFTLSCKKGTSTWSAKADVVVGAADQCTDIAGVQSAIPTGCQTGPTCVPTGYYYDATADQCKPLDVCTDISGTQAAPPPGCQAGPTCVPTGDVYNGTACVPATLNGVVDKALTATPSRVRKGGTVTLSWNTTGMASCLLKDQSGSSLSSLLNSAGLPVVVNSQTTFSLSCFDGAETFTSSARVTIIPSYLEI